MKRSAVLRLVLAGIILLFSACSAPESAAPPAESGAPAASPALPEDGETNPAAPAQIQLLMQGKLGGLGMGCLVCALPEEDGEDYRICFYEGDFSSREPDYVFPDVREGNAPIGVFQEIYFSDTIVVGGDGAPGLAVIADYDVNGETRCDVRIYRWDGTDYLPEDGLMASFNKVPRVGDDFPVEELYRLGPDNTQPPAEAAAGDWASAYRQVLLDLEANLSDPWDLRAGPEPDLYVGIHDFDGDGTPELVAGDCVSVAVFTCGGTGGAVKTADLYQPAERGNIDELYLGDNTLVLVSTGADAGCYVCLTWLDGAYHSGTYNAFAPERSNIDGQPAGAEEFRRVFSPRFLPDAMAYCQRVGDTLIINGEEIPIDNLDFSLLAW